VNNPKRMAEIAARCFDRAMLEMGPAQLNIPRDFFYGEIEATISPPMRIAHGPGCAKALDAAAATLAAAQFPVILAGGGVIMSGATAEAVALAELLGAPVCNSYLHNDSFPASHGLAVGPLGYQGSKAAMKLIAQADVVLALGTRLGPFGTLPQHGLDYWPKQAKIIQIDADPRMLGLVKPISVAIHGDARAAAGALLERLKGRTLAASANRAERAARINAEKQAWEAELDAWTHERDAYSIEVARGSQYMHPRQMLRELEKAMPGNAMVSTDIGNICSVANSYLRFDAPRSMFAAMSFGNCGYAFPVICGAKVASPDRPAFAYVGDGAWGISFNELLTCARRKIGVTVVVFNNEQWGAEKKNHVDFYSRRYQGVNLENPSWAGVARAFGCEGVTVERLADVRPVVEAAARAQSEGRTTVLEMMVTKELGDPFRRDALSKPVRWLEKYRAFT
jgi:sulfoacetaldehyde acetyltransferase